MYARLGDAFAAKLNATGGALVYSTYLGGGSDDFAQGIAVDSQGSAYVVGRTNSGDFPTKNAFQPTDHGSDDVFVDKLTPGGDALAYGTFLGGGGDDIGYGIAADNSGKAVVTGQAVSNFPITANAPQFTYGGGGIDAFVAEVDTTLSGTASLVYSTFLGGNGEEYGYGAALDCAGNAYVTGRTSATTFITTTGGVQPGAGGGGNDAFVEKIGATRVITYAYDGVQRLTDAVECPGSTYHDGYDPASNRTLETVDGTPTQQVSYDAANQVITDTTPGGTAAYSYDGAGNLLSDGGSSYRYDALDRLTALAGAGATEAYGYNGDGVLVTQTVNGTPTAYTQDLAASQSQVLQTATGTGTPAVTDYLYGLDRLASVPSGGSMHTWYMPDLQGSVRYTTDDGANASPTVNYDPYGTPESGAVPPTFGYDGELQDGATGLQNLRARTYNPATGQFLTRDPLEQQTGQAYLYAGGDPVNGSDPSGACYIPNTHRDAALPGVQPDDQNCAISTVDDALSRILSTSKSPIYYPTEADKTCLYQQILRDIPGARSALPKGFYVSPARQVRTVIHRGGSVFNRAFTAVVAIGEDAVGVANEAAQAVAAAEGILQGAGQAVVEKPVIPLAGVLGAAATGFIAGIVTQPTLHDADTPENLLDSVKKLKYDEEDPNLPVVCFGIAIGTRLPGCSSLGPKLDAPGGLLVPQIALHILYAQLSGYPSVLTYNGPYPDDDPNSPTIMNRNAACGGRTEGATTESRARLKETDQLLGITRGRANTATCDEYPFASTMQGGAGSSIAKVAGDQNRRQGTILSRFYGVALMQEPKPFRVHIIP